MVVFTCNHCGASLRKPTVEKHYAFSCRRSKSLTCVDCLKDFMEEEYVAHTKCLTEEERYAAKGSMPNGVIKKGEVKQELWVDMIKSILEKESNLKPSHKNLLEIISNHSNIPRKKPKFMNFIKSSSGGRVNMKEVEDVWNLIEKYKINKASQNGASNNTKLEQSSKRKINEETSTETIDSEQPKKKKKKKKESNTKNEENNDNPIEATLAEPTGNDKFNFELKMLSILESKGTISLKKLEKKVINAYLKHSGESEATPKIVKKINKKLKKIPNVEIVNDEVSLKD